jgi:N-acetylmuramoyl-L-alanine amidase
MNKKISLLGILCTLHLIQHAADGRSSDTSLKESSSEISIHTDRSLPHFDPDRRGIQPTVVVFNYSGHAETKESIDALDSNKVSGHFLIGQDGSIHQLVDPQHRAWHAGHARLKLGTTLESDVNSHSIGIILANRGMTNTVDDASAELITNSIGGILNNKPTYAYRYTNDQISAIVSLVSHLKIKDYDIKTFTSHAEVATSPQGIAGRKIGPGPLFPWKELAEHGIGFWPKEDTSLLPESEEEKIKEAQRFLHLQHDCPETGEIDAHTKALLISFQMHYTPENITGLADDITLHAMRSLHVHIENLQKEYSFKK